MTHQKALILVDLQNDFCEGGRLAVPGGGEVIRLANQLQQQFDLTIATQDWHPQDHTSFAENHPGCAVGDVVEVDGLKQILWPVHCVQNTRGAEFHPDLDTSKIHRIFHKGTDINIDSYSAFYDNAHRRSTGLEEYLRSEGVGEVYIMGLATDYCVKYSVLDALHHGFKVSVVRDGCRAVELKEGDGDRAFEEMKKAGARIR